MRLIDADKFEAYSANGTDLEEEEFLAYLSGMQRVLEDIDAAPTIDPETLPIVRQLRAELEQVKADRDAAIEYLREIEWCAGCKHFGGLDGCKNGPWGQCTEKHDLYEFIGPQKED